MKHKHHIIPKYEGGTEEGNIVELSITCHAMWHFAEYQRKGNWQDKLAFRILTGRITKEEAVREAVREQNRNREQTPELRRRVSEGNKRHGAKIHCIELNKTWLCAKDAGEELGMSSKVIYEVARGAKKSYRGLHFTRVGKVEYRPQFNQQG